VVNGVRRGLLSWLAAALVVALTLVPVSPVGEQLAVAWPQASGTNTFTGTATVAEATSFSASLLPSGKVLIAGGCNWETNSAFCPILAELANFVPANSSS